MSMIEKIHQKLYNFCDWLENQKLRTQQKNENNFRFLVQDIPLRKTHVWRERTHNSDFIIAFRSLSKCNEKKSPVAI